MGCVAVGVLLEGSIRIPIDLRILPGPGSTTPVGTVSAIAATANRKETSVLTTGIKSGLTLRGVQKLPGFGRYVKWNLHKGDQLVYP